MQYEFVKVNKTIFDYKQYIKEVEWLKYDVKKRLINILEKDFIIVKEFEEKYDSLHIVFYNKRLDLKIEVECFKQKKELFV